MNFKDVVKLHELVMGDRFYFLHDKKKTVQVVLDITSPARPADGKNHGAKYCKSLMLEKQQQLARRNIPFPISKYTKTQDLAEHYDVVFLRHEIKIA